MEKQIRIERDQKIIGVLYDDNNNVRDGGKAKGEFTVLKDKNNQITLRHTGSKKTYSCHKSKFDAGERIPRRIPHNKSKETVEREQQIEKRKATRKLSSKERTVEETLKKREEARKKFQEEQEKQGKKAVVIPDCTDICTFQTEDKIIQKINQGQKNIWLVGPAGSGKTTLCQIVAKKMHKPFLLLSCGEGTAPSEFTGRRFPKKEETDFIKYITKPAIIVIDEFPALMPETAQMLNAGLANDYISTVFGPRYRHKDCIIVATSNTFGTGADAMYVANNQLDASTRDRFVGGFIQVDYSKKYEYENYNKQAVDYVHMKRKVIGDNYLQRIASTRMIQTAHRMIENNQSNWKDELMVDYTEEERNIIREGITTIIKEKKEEHIRAVKKALGASDVKEDVKEDVKKQDDTWPPVQSVKW